MKHKKLLICNVEISNSIEETKKVRLKLKIREVAGHAKRALEIQTLSSRYAL